MDHKLTKQLEDLLIKTGFKLGRNISFILTYW
jgi:hypothetical protein